jgi:hypothetical protein
MTAASRSILVPLIAALVSWAVFMLAIYTDLFVTDVFDDGVRVGQQPAVAASTYLFFVAIAVFGVAALWGQRVAISARVQEGPESRPERAAHRFATLDLIVAMALAAILAISAFLEGFGRSDQQGDLAVRFGNVYGPILLYTALVVTILLWGFVFRRDTLPKSSDLISAEIEEGGTGLSGQRDLGASYAIPIVATAVALIFGLIVYDATGNALEVWVWVAIQLVIGAGVVAGTIFGERAIAQGPTSHSSRSRITRGARGLSFVLSIVFAAVVGLMGFGYGSSAIESLRSNPYFFVNIVTGPNTPLERAEVSINGTDLAEGSTISIVLEPVGEELLVEEITDSDYFYDTRPLPGNLEAGDYTLVAQATAEDGRGLTREVDFEVSAEGQVLYDPQLDIDSQWEEDNTVISEADGEWFVEDFLPSLVLITLSLAVIYLTLTQRNTPVRGVGKNS